MPWPCASTWPTSAWTAVMTPARVGVQLGVGEVVLGRGELALGLLDLGERGRGERLALVERLRRERGAAAQR